MTVINRIPLILSLSFALLVVGCGSNPVKTDADASSTELHLDTLQSFLDQKDGLSEQQIEYRKVEAAAFLIKEKRLDWAHKLIDTVQIKYLEPANIAYFILTKSKLAIEEGEPYLAQRFLFSEPVHNNIETAPVDVRIALYDLRAQLMLNQSEYLRSVEERLMLAELIQEDKEHTQLNHDLIWEALSEVPTDELFSLSKIEKNPAKQGWLSLAALSKSNGANFRKQIVDIEEWQIIWPDHAASQILPADLQLILQLADAQAKSIAVFLPMSGKLAAAGTAIKEGIFAAYYDDVTENGITPDIQFFDTHQQDIHALYDHALALGTELIIGPLNKDNVTALASRSELPIPVLALNTIRNKQIENTPIEAQSTALQDSNPNSEQVTSEGLAESHSVLKNGITNRNVFQFTLAVESEAEQVALRAWRDGHRQALIIAPTSSWGDRGASAFKKAWEEIGGELIDDRRYKDQRSYSSLIEASVAVDQSKRRKREIQRILGTNLEFEPRRRKDVDFIFLLALPTQGKQLKPLLAYHYAGDIPVYSTSQIYTGDGAEGLSDLNGLRFSAMPWHFDNTLNERRAIKAYGENHSAFQALYAMGVDAYHIYPRLEQLQLIRNAQFYGSTGKLRVVDHNIIQRTQNWAEIQKGGAVELTSQALQESDI